MYAGDVYILDGSDVVGMIERILFRKWPRTMINRFFVPPDMKKAVMSKSKSGDSRADKPVVTKDLCLPFERQSYADRNYPYVDNSHPPPGKNHLAPEKNHHDYPATTNIKAYAHPDNPKATPNGVGPMPDDVGSMPNGVRAMTNGVRSMPNSVGTFTTEMGTMPAKLRTIHTTCEAPKREATAKSSIVSRALAIISEEIAVEVANLTEDTSFLDLGIDSLMSLVLAQKFRSEIGVDVRDSLFIEFPTIGHLCQRLEKS
jgi:acyl carrier protein